jgi:hypothetical protein
MEKNDINARGSVARISAQREIRGGLSIRSSPSRIPRIKRGSSGYSLFVKVIYGQKVIYACAT